MNNETAQALAELVEVARQNMEWEAGFVRRYARQVEALDILKMTTRTESNIQSSEQVLAAYQLLADHLQIKLPSRFPLPQTS